MSDEVKSVEWDKVSDAAEPRPYEHPHVPDQIVQALREYDRQRQTCRTRMGVSDALE